MSSAKASSEKKGVTTKAEKDVLQKKLRRILDSVASRGDSTATEEEKEREVLAPVKHEVTQNHITSAQGNTALGSSPGTKKT